MTNLSPLLLHQGEMQEQPGPLSQVVKRMREVSQYRALPPSSRLRQAPTQSCAKPLDCTESHAN